MPGPRHASYPNQRTAASSSRRPPPSPIRSFPEGRTPVGSRDRSVPSARRATTLRCLLFFRRKSTSPVLQGYSSSRIRCLHATAGRWLLVRSVRPSASLVPPIEIGIRLSFVPGGARSID